MARRAEWTGLRGDLNTYEMSGKGGRLYVATLAAADPAGMKPLPDLYEPVPAGMSTLAFRLRGFERHEGPDGPYSVAQEWHCERSM